MNVISNYVLEGSGQFLRSRSVVIGIVLWVLWSALLYWLFSLIPSFVTLLLAGALVCWDGLLVYLIVRSAWVRIETSPDAILVFGWFRNRVIHRTDIRSIYHVEGAVPLVVAVSFSVRAIPASWYLVVDTLSSGVLPIESSFAERSSSVSQLDGLRAWFEGSAAEN